MNEIEVYVDDSYVGRKTYKEVEELRGHIIALNNFIKDSVYADHIIMCIKKVDGLQITEFRGYTGYFCSDFEYERLVKKNGENYLYDTLHINKVRTTVRI